MGKLTKFNIVLNNAQAVYNPGDSLEGHVAVNLAEDIKTSRIFVKLVGAAHVSWSEQHGKTTRTYTSTQNYFKLIWNAYKPENPDDLLPAGEYKYNFTYTLPAILPSSYESYIGNVRYKIVGVIERPWRFDHKTRKIFTVLSVLDLNNLPAIVAEHDEAENSKMLCCWCCTSGPISAKLRLDRIGYVPGETIYVKADISNLSRRKMKASRVVLLMVVVYHAASKSRQDISTVRVVSRGPIPAGDEDTWTSEPFLVPAVPPSDLNACAIIDIEYVLQLEVVPSGPANCLKVPMNIIIGTIPLRQVNSPTRSATVSYNESALGRQSVQEVDDTVHTSGDREFAPAYTYYNWTNDENN